jgi:hypothetical protein
MPSKTCCRSCPRCDDCPVLVAAAARARRRETQADAITSLVDDVFTGAVGVARRRPLPEHIERMLETLDAARRGEARAAEPAAA